MGGASRAWVALTVHILFLTHYYPPESNAPANRVSEMARAWVRAGHRVTVVTTAPNHPGGQVYPGYQNRSFFSELRDGVTVIRLGTFLATNEGIFRRSLSYLSYLLAVATNLHRIPKTDVVISTSPQLFAGVAGALAGRFHRRPWIFEVRDIWPESVSAVGAIKGGPVIRALEWIERWAYKNADQVVSVSHAFIPHISSRGPLRRAVAVVENGVDLEAFDGEAADTDFRKRHGLQGKVVFGYVGTHGMAHGLETLLRAAASMREDTRVAFVMVGAGAERPRLLALKAELGLDNVVMLDHQTRHEMPAILSSIDVSLVLLKRSDAFLRVIPSKMFEAMAMSQPIILGVDGEARRIVDQGDAGIFIEPEDLVGLAAAVRRLADDPDLRARLGENGRRFVRSNYDRAVLADRYLGIIDQVLEDSACLRSSAKS